MFGTIPLVTVKEPQTKTRRASETKSNIANLLRPKHRVIPRRTRSFSLELTGRIFEDGFRALFDDFPLHCNDP